jgi:hypothetical protein
MIQCVSVYTVLMFEFRVSHMLGKCFMTEIKLSQYKILSNIHFLIFSVHTNSVPFLIPDSLGTDIALSN